MSTPRPSRRPGRRAAAALVAGLLPLVLTACGAGQDAQTYQERNGADNSDTAVGAIALRGLAIEAPTSGLSHPAGSDVDVVLTLTNADDAEDRLLEVTTPAASEVELLVEQEAEPVVVPALGTTAGTVTLRLVGLTSELRQGEYVPMTFRFERSGSVEVNVPVATAGTTDRPVYTAEEGSEEGEPALQAPAGGHGEEHSEDEGEAGQEGEEGVVDAGEEGEAEAPTTEETPAG